MQTILKVLQGSATSGKSDVPLSEVSSSTQEMLALPEPKERQTKPGFHSKNPLPSSEGAYSFTAVADRESVRSRLSENRHFAENLKT